MAGTDYSFCGFTLLSAPCPVQWAGWRSDTMTLQRQGWQISAEKNFARMSVRLLMKHRSADLLMLTEFNDMDFDYYAHDPYRGAPFHFSVVLAGSRILESRVLGHVPAFAAFDAEPMRISLESIKLHELDVFRPVQVETAEEILIDQADMSVIEHLQAIKDLQSDQQRELRAKARRVLSQGEIIETTPEQSVVVQMVNYR